MKHNPITFGDFNTWTEDWGSREISVRGRILIEAFLSLNVVLPNTDGVNIFRRSAKNFTFVNDTLSKDLQCHLNVYIATMRLLCSR